MGDENGNGNGIKKRLSKKHWNVIKISSAIAAVAAGWAGAKYLYAETIVPAVEKTVTSLYDSLTSPMEDRIEEIAEETEVATLASMKTQVYLEKSLTQDVKNTAEAQWKHDSAIYMMGKKKRR